MYLQLGTAVIIAAGTPAGVSSAHSPDSVTVAPAPTVSVSTDGLEDLLRFLREVLILIGGDPGVLSDQTPPEVWYATISTYYTLHGVPPGLTPLELANARVLTAQTYSAVSSCTSIVGFVPTTLFKATLKSMYADLGGNPADLD